MNCKFIYFQGKLRICRYFSKNPFLHLSEKLDIKHLYIINLKKNFIKIMFFFMYRMKIFIKR